MDELKREEPNEEELRKIFEEMEFRTLIDRVFNRDKKSAFAGTYTDATGNDPQGRFFTPGPLLLKITEPVRTAICLKNLRPTGDGRFQNIQISRV